MTLKVTSDAVDLADLTFKNLPWTSRAASIRMAGTYALHRRQVELRRAAAQRLLCYGVVSEVRVEVDQNQIADSIVV